MDIHKTCHPNIFGYIEKINGQYLTGWLIKKNHDNKLLPLPNNSIKMKNRNQDIEFIYGVKRTDVSTFYGDNDETFLECGFFVNLIKDERDNFEILYIDEETSKTFRIFEINYSYDISELEFNETNIPSFIVVDNFYKDPDIVRNFALQQEFIFNPLSHKGKRTEQDFHNNIIKRQFEKILGVPITKWDYKWNGCFQYCIAEDKLVIHCDVQKYAGIVYLTPDAPPSSGTSFFRHKRMKNRFYSPNTFDKGHYDFTDFDLVDTVGNVYNRLIIFNAQLIHSAGEYFGTNQHNGRLFQIFFFDI